MLRCVCFKKTYHYLDFQAHFIVQMKNTGICLSVFLFGIFTIGLLGTNAAFGTHMIDRSATADMDDWFTINAEPMNESTILVTGHAPRTAMEPVEITVTAPNGNVVSVDELTVDSDFNYMTKIKTSAKLWNVNGVYVITAMQGPAKNNNMVSTYVEVVNGLISNFNLNYQIDNGFVSNIESESNSNSLIISIDTEVYDKNSVVFGETKRDGVLTIELPRKVIDAKISGTEIDSQFVVLVDGTNNPYEEVISSSVRTLTISFPYGTEEIKITGSYADPEFGVSSFSELSFSEPSLNPTISEPVTSSELTSQDVKVKETSVTSSDTSFLTIFGAIAAVTVGAVLIAYLKGIF